MAPLGDRYDIVAPIGAGTAANVFQVRDRRGGAIRAAKVLKAENARVPAILARFEDEYRILRNLHHPHLPEVHDYGETADGGRYLVMEFVDGEPLDAYFRAHPGDLWVILYQIGEILTFIHNHALLHQDIKPSNILVKRTNAFGDEIPLVKLIDFGVTHRRDSGARADMVGTPEYMAPEVALGTTPFTRAVDYYSLGVVLYELLCGRTPFSGSVSEVLRAHIDRTPVIEDEELEWTELYPAVHGLLAKDSRPRLESFEELRRTLVTRLTGGIRPLDRAYGAARIESLGMIGKAAELQGLQEATLSPDGRPARVVITGQPLSGRSHFVEEARCEWRIRGVKSWKLGDNSDAAWLLNRPEEVSSPPTEKDFEQAWALVQRSAAQGPAWIVACGELTPDEQRLYEYLETGRTLAGPAVRRNLGFIIATTRDQPSAGDDALHIVLPTLTATETGGVVDRFRGELLRTADAQLLSNLLKDARESGEIMLLLRRLVARDGLLFEATRWRVDAEQARKIAREPAGMARHLVLPLSPVQRRVMTALACHPGPVPVGWLPGVTGLDDGAVAGVLHDLRLRHLLEPVDLNGTSAVRTTSRTVEQSVLREAEPVEMREIHARYVNRLAEHGPKDVVTGTEHLRLLALHQERSGDERSAYLSRRRLFRDVWTERKYELIEQTCREAMAAESIQFGLARAYLRELVNVLWAQNLTARAYHDMTAFAERFGEVPKGLLPRYARGLSDTLGPKKGLKFVEGAIKKARKVSETLVARLQVEQALVLYNLSRYDAGLAVAADVQKKNHLLTPREQCRLQIYWALLQPGVSTAAAQRYLAKAELIAQKHSLADELATIQVLQTINNVDSGRPKEAIRLIARTTRAVVRNRLVLRQYQLYAQAASAYSEIGDNVRAIKYRERTVWMAQYLGHRILLASSWWRVAYYSEKHGEFGNAIRYYDQAMPLIREASRKSDYVQAQVLQSDLHGFIGSKRARSLRIRATAALKETSDTGEQGSLRLGEADQMLRSGRWSEARDTYSFIRRTCIKGGRRDDAVRATAGEARALVFMGASEASNRLLVDLRKEIHKFGNVDATARLGLAELTYCFSQRQGGKDTLRILKSCESVLEQIPMTTRLDLLPPMFRSYARMGRLSDARRIFDGYENDIRSIASNLEDEELARSFLQRINYAELVREATLLERQSARIDHVDAGTP